MNVIYGLVDPITNQLRYVGRSVNYNERSKRIHSAKCGAWQLELRKQGLFEEAFIIDEYETMDELILAEIHYISYFKSIGCDLLNVLPGGEGCKVPAWNKGKTWPEEIRMKMRKPKTRKTPRKTGWSLSDEARQKISAAMTGRERSESFCKKTAERVKKEWAEGKRPARKWTEEQKIAQAEKIRQSWLKRKAQ